MGKVSICLAGSENLQRGVKDVKASRYTSLRQKEKFSGRGFLPRKSFFSGVKALVSAPGPRGALHALSSLDSKVTRGLLPSAFVAAEPTEAHACPIHSLPSKLPRLGREHNPISRLYSRGEWAILIRQVLEKFCRQARKANLLLREYTLTVFDQSKK